MAVPRDNSLTPSRASEPFRERPSRIRACFPFRKLPARQLQSSEMLSCLGGIADTSGGAQVAAPIEKYRRSVPREACPPAGDGEGTMNRRPPLPPLLPKCTDSLM